MFYKHLLDEFVALSKSIMGTKLTGIYLHGSMAMNCFNPDKSDLDLLVVIETDMSYQQKMEFLEGVVTLNNQALKNGLEISVVKRQHCKPFTYPTPYELHFSLMHMKSLMDNPKDYVKRMKGEDKDLAAHFTIINQCGIVLYGEAIENVFGEVPIKNYVESIWLDVKDSRKAIMDKPIDVTLNLLRVLAFLKEGLYLSKKAAGEWGGTHTNKKYQSYIFQALKSYCTNISMQFDPEIAHDFADQILTIIEIEVDRKFPGII